MSLLTTNSLVSAPAGASDITLNNDLVSAWVWGPWQQFIAALPNQAQIAGISWRPGSNANASFDVECGIGLPGAEISVGSPIRFEIPNTGGSCITTFMLPTPVDGYLPLGAAVSMRLRGDSTGPLTFTLLYYLGLDSDHKTMYVTGAFPVTAAPAVNTPSGIAWTDSAATTLIASLPNDVYVYGLGVLCSNLNSVEVEFDLCTGATAATVVTTFRIEAGPIQPRLQYDHLTGLLKIAAGTKVSVKTRQSNTAVGTHKVALLYHDAPTPPAPPVPANDYPCNMDTPQTWGVINTAGSRFLYSPRPLPDDSDYYDGPKFPRQKSIGRIEWPSSDWLTGYLPATTFTTSLIEFDKYFRSLSRPSLIGSEVYQYLLSRATRIAKGNPTLLFRGIIRGDPRTEELNTEIEATDIISTDYQFLKDDKLIPQRTMFDDFNFNRDLGVPIIGGEILETGGGLKIVYGGTITVGGTNYVIAPVACHACKGGITNAYDSTGTPLVWGTDAWAPGQTGWTTIQPSGALYFDINGRRYTPILLRPAATVTVNFIAGSPIYVNTKGLEDLGDGTGTQFTDLHLLYRFIFIQFFIQNYQSGAYATTPTFAFYPGSASTVSVVDEASFATASSGLLGSVVIGAEGRRSSIRDEIAKANVSCNIIMYQNNSSQIAVNRLTTSRLTLLGSTRTVTDRRDIYTPPGLRYWANRDWFFNDHGYQAHANYRGDGTGDWNYFNINGNAPSVAKYKTATITEQYHWIRDQTSADTIAGERLAFAGPDPPRLCTWEQSICGMGLYVGNGVPITDFRGSGGTGWNANATWIISRWLDIARGRVGFIGVDVNFYVS